MATSFARLDEPPPSPPNVSGQMGAGGAPPGVQVSQMIGQRAEGERPPGGLTGLAETHPQGFLMAQADACTKLLRQMARSSPEFAPFAAKAESVIQAGVGEAISTGRPGPVPNEARPGPTGLEFSNRPPTGEAARGFPG